MNSNLVLQNKNICRTLFKIYRLCTVTHLKLIPMGCLNLTLALTRKIFGKVDMYQAFVTSHVDGFSVQFKTFSLHSLDERMF